MAFFDCSGRPDGGPRSTEVGLRGNGGSVMGLGVSDGVRLIEGVRQLMGNWQRYGSEPKGENVEGVLSGATVVGRNDTDRNQFGSVSGLG